MSSPAVSVVISCYNGEKFLRPALDSILNQTFSDFEFIVLNNASTDGTAKILDNYHDPRMVKLKNDTLLDMCASFNKGHAMAQGRYIAHLDADDVALPDRLAKQVTFLDSHPDVGMVATQYEFIKENNEIQKSVLTPIKSEDLYESLATGNLIAHSSVTFRKDVLDQFGHYPLTYEYAEDYAIYIDVASRANIACLPDLLTQIRLHAGQITNAPEWRERQLTDVLDLLRKAANLPKLSKRAQRDNRQAVCDALLRYGVFLARDGRHVKAFGTLLEGMLTDPLHASRRLRASLRNLGSRISGFSS